MRRLSRREEGVTAVFILFMMVPLFGMAGYVIDVGLVRQERRELQNGADAAALDLAQDCANGLCTNLQSKADTRDFAGQNAKDGKASVTGVTVSGATVKVDTRTLTSSNATSLTMQFAQLFGHSNSTVTATATAGWGAPGGATTLPLTFSYCQWKSMTNNNTVYPTAELTILFKGDDVTTCAGPAGQNMPGGFGWIDTVAACASVVTAGNQIGSDPGNGNPHNNGCNPADILNKDLLIPVFSAFAGSGQNGTYTIYGLATFHVTGMRLANSNGWHTPPEPCGASQRCIKGYFLRDIIPWTGGSLGGGPNLGTLSVKLVA